MSIERKVAVAICLFCLVALGAGLIIAAFITHPILGWLSLAIVAWWFGSSVAAALKDTEDKS